MEVRPIDANALVNTLEDWRGDREDVDENDALDAAYYAAMSRAIRLSENAPTIDYELVVHGKWIENEGFDGDTYYSCSACGQDWFCPDGTPAENNMHFCPCCGAKMDRRLE